MLTLCLAALFFPAYVCGCVREGRGNPLSAGVLIGSNVSIGSHFFYVL